MRSKAHDDAMAELYRSDPEFAVQVINSILEDGDLSERLIVLRQMTKAFGGMQAVAKQAHLNTTQLYRTLSLSLSISTPDSPALSRFSTILKAIGLRLAVQPQCQNA